MLNSTRKGTVERNVLALAARYQRRFPQVLEGSVVPGAVTLGAREPLLQDYARLMIPEQRLREILLNSKDSIEEVSHKLVGYLLEKNNLSAEKTTAELQELFTYLGGDKKRELIHKEDLAQLASLKRMELQDAAEFIKETDHLIGTCSCILIGPIYTAIGIMQRNALLTKRA